jgi:hypothetical protein
MAEPQIIVPDSSTPKQLLTAAQYLVAMACSFAIGRGWVGPDLVVQITAAVPAVVAVAYGIYRTWQNNEEKKTIINSPDTKVPAAVAKVVK